MASIQYIINKTAYTLVSATDNFLNNESNYNIRIIYDTLLPDPSDTGYKTLKAGQTFIRKDAFPAGNTYALLEPNALADSARISVMEI